jgi:hypothetical protein
MAQNPKFPVVILPWDDSKQSFEIEYLDKSEKTKELMLAKDF